jgi:hypothetical protein
MPILIKDIHVTDVDADSFEKLLVYMYKKTVVDLDGMSMEKLVGLHRAGFFINLESLLKFGIFYEYNLLQNFYNK